MSANIARVFASLQTLSYYKHDYNICITKEANCVSFFFFFKDDKCALLKQRTPPEKCLEPSHLSFL